MAPTAAVAPPGDTPNGTARFGQQFFDWVAQHEGVVVHPRLRTEFFECGMTGLACTEALSEGDLVIRVPLGACGRLLSEPSSSGGGGGGGGDSSARGLRALQAALAPVCARQEFREKSGAEYAELALQVLLSDTPLWAICIQACCPLNRGDVGFLWYRHETRK